MGVVAGDSVTSADHTRHGPATRLSGRVPTTPVAQRPKPLLLRERAACRTGHRMCRRDQDRFTPSTYRFEPVMKPLCPEARKVTAAAQSSWRPSVTCAARCTPGPVACSRSGASPDRPGGVGLAQPDGVDPDAAPLEFTGPGTGERTGGGRGRRVHAERLRADVTRARPNAWANTRPAIALCLIIGINGSCPKQQSPPRVPVVRRRTETLTFWLRVRGCLRASARRPLQ